MSPNKEITVRYNLAETSDFIAEEGIGKKATLDFTNGSTSDTLAIAIVPDNVAETNGTITLTLVDDTANPRTYKVAAAPANTKAISVKDDDALPFISIAAENGGVAENAGPATFEISATGLTASTTLMINATPKEDGGDFIKDAYEVATDFSVTFYDYDGDDVYTGTLTLAVVDDQSMQVNLLKDNTDGGPTGSIKLELNVVSTDYRLGSTTEGTKKIWDNETPELHVSADYTVTEGDNVMVGFIIANNVSPNDQFLVHFDLVRSGGDFLAEYGTDKTAMVSFAGSGRDDTINFTLINDDVAEDNGTITFTLKPDTTGEVDYTVAAAPDNSDVINVIDDDSLPEVSIAADSGSVAENVIGGNASFMLTATGLTADTTLEINATPNENGEDFLRKYCCWKSKRL